jgi:Na+-transporting methylmalonyl-CoA/oxaloacetate decarboxylase gamma subunit
MVGQSISLAIIGLLIVFVVLAFLATIIALVSKADERWQRMEKAAAQAALAESPTIDNLTMVLIAAAAATYLTGRHRIRRVRRLLPRDAPSSPWSHQGRLVLMGSHSVRRGR